jgi:hypothetical protein
MPIFFIKLLTRLRLDQEAFKLKHVVPHVSTSGML